MVAPPISLGLNHSLREDDVFRALFCSVAVYFDNAEAENFFQKTLVHEPHITFDKLDMALDVPDGQKILVAYSGNDVFIAFKGTESLFDVASDIMVNNQFKFGGSFHRGFFDRSCMFMASDRSDFNPLPGLLAPGKRVIFCGHSLGGAVAHMVLLRLWLEGEEFPSRDTYANSLFSIAFGAPHICNDKAAGLINNNENLRWRFITFVNQSDPVPLMLHHIRRTILARLRGSFLEADSGLQELGGFLGRSIQGFGNGASVGSGFKSATRDAGRLAGKRFVTGVQQYVLLPVADALGASNSSSSEVPDFHPIGQYICLVQQDGDWGVDTLFGDGLTLHAFLDKELEFTRQNLEQHTIGSYKTTLTAIYGPSARGMVISSMPHQSPHLLVRTPAPKVTFAKWIFDEDLVPQYIQVRGENLLFLREAVSINGLELWRIVFPRQSDKELILCRPSTPNQRVSSQKINFSEKAVTHVIIKTAFGQTHHPILEDYPNSTTEIGVSRMISKIVQALIVKATPSLSICPPDKVKNSLDDIMHCVLESKGKKISTELVKVTKCDDVLRLEHHCKEINHMLGLVGKYLKSSLKVKYFESNPLGNIRRSGHSFLVESGVTKAGTSVGIVAFLAVDLRSGIPIGSAMLGASLAVNLILSPKESVFTEYEDVLKCAIEEASKWSELDRSGANTNPERKLEDLEKELIEQVKRSTPFEKMVKGALTCTDPRLKSDLLRGATRESRLKLLKRIKLVYDTIDLYNLEVAGVHFMGIFGAEDAGKSTFIKKVLKKIFPLREDLQLPEARVDSHTKIVKSYKLNDSLWLVDFPGSDGAGPYADKWKQFTSLSSSSVLLLNFEYDVKEEQVRMYREMKTNLGAQTVVTIVFNKVDQRFTPRNQEQFSTEYFKDLKQKTETELGCTAGSKDTVHYACVDPDIPSQDLTKLKAMGVLGFEELHNHLVAGLMTESSTRR